MRTDTPVAACTLLIPTYNGLNLLQRCLESIERHRPGQPPLEILVVDDASTDQTVDWLHAHHPEVRVVVRRSNGGFCRAVNTGLALTRTKYVQVLNNDTEVCAGWLEAGLAAFRDNRVASVAPLVLWSSNPDRVDSAGDCLTFFGWPGKRGHGQPASRWERQRLRPVFSTSASSGFYRCDALARLGGFETWYGSYYEDVDLGLRLRRLGFVCLFQPASRILHQVSASYDHANPRLQRRLSRNAEALFWTGWPPLMLMLAVIPHLIFLIVQLGWKFLRGQAGPVVRGKWDALCAFSQLWKIRRTRTQLFRRPIYRPSYPWTFWPATMTKSTVRGSLSNRPHVPLRPRQSSRSRGLNESATVIRSSDPSATLCGENFASRGDESRG